MKYTAAIEFTKKQIEEEQRISGTHEYALIEDNKELQNIRDTATEACDEIEVVAGIKKKKL